MAVEVINGCKQFGQSAPVLSNLNLLVEQGSIYGLLGASGCGKTTLLSCIVGLKKLDSGEIFVFGSQPGTKESGIPGNCLGYMPQETALISMFTIKEMLSYYGRIYGMSYSEIEQRTKFLSAFLELPNTSKLTCNLSGGQARRTSLACALIHKPPLIILDEPTVGLDPVLRANIWEHLVELVAREKTTIIITTHYIEESRFCDTVGILRKGRLLAEDSPKSLLSLHNSDSLEKVVLQLCHNATSRRLSNLKNNNYSNKTGNWSAEHFVLTGVELTRMRKLPTGNGGDELNIMQMQPKMNNGKVMEMKKPGWQRNVRIIGALMTKTLLRQIRHPAAIVVQLILPILQILIYENIVGVEPKGCSIGIVSSDWNKICGNHRANTTTINELLGYCSALYGDGHCLLSGSEDGMSSICGFMNQFDKGEIYWIYEESAQLALHSIHKGNMMGYVEFPVNFTNNLRDRFLEKNFIGNETLSGSTINIRMDVTSALNNDWVYSTLLKRYQTFLEKSVMKCGGNPKTVQLPLHHHAVYGDNDGSWILYIQPALIMIYMFVLANLPSVMMVMEKREGVTDRGAVAGIKFGHTIIASFLSDSFMILAQIAIFFSVLPIFYGMSVVGSWALAIVLVYVSALSGLSFGIWWATMTNHEIELILVLLFVNITNIISSGLLWPLEAVVSSYRVFCLCLPASIPIQALRSIMFKGFGLEHPTVLYGFLVAILWTVVPILLSFMCVRFKK